jgi:WD40-like Beta Propeller Repeat
VFPFGSHRAFFYSLTEGGFMRHSHIRFTFTFCVVLALTVIASAGAEQFSDWSPPVSLGPVINTEFDDSGAFISRDGLTLYFNSNSPADWAVSISMFQSATAYAIQGGLQRTWARRSTALVARRSN